MNLLLQNGDYGENGENGDLISNYHWYLKLFILNQIYFMIFTSKQFLDFNSFHLHQKYVLIFLSFVFIQSYYFWFFHCLLNQNVISYVPISIPIPIQLFLSNYFPNYQHQNLNYFIRNFHLNYLVQIIRYLKYLKLLKWLLLFSFFCVREHAICC